MQQKVPLMKLEEVYIASGVMHHDMVNLLSQLGKSLRVIR